MERFDLAVIGAGIAGTYVADAMQARKPGWSIALFERSGRIGGRLFSVSVPGIDHRIELGGMRFLTSHDRMASVVADLGLSSHPFDATGGPARSYLRGHFADGPTDPASGAGYDLAPGERDRSAGDLFEEALRRIVPGAGALDAAGYRRARDDGRFGERALVDRAIGDALREVVSHEAARFVSDAFGYDSGLRPFNAGDAVEFVLGGGDPTAVARTPDDGMDAVPRGLAARFEARAGAIRLDHELRSVAVADGGALCLDFGTGAVLADHVVLAVAAPALAQLGTSSAVLGAPAVRRLLASVEGFPAMKLYLWYERPWWRPTVRGIRLTTDLPVRKVFYVDSRRDAPAALLAMYTDGRHVDPWRPLWNGAPAGSPASAAMLAEVNRQLRVLHPEVADLPSPSGSALQFWGSDPLEIGWAFWRPGARSDEMIDLAVQPERSLPLYLAGETYSRAQSWAEGALETAQLVVERLTRDEA
jgi:monoamine oxidase